MLEEARKEGFLEDAQIFSLAEKVRSSVAGPSRMIVTRLHELSDEELESTLDKRHLTRFSVDHTHDLLIARGDPVDMADYNKYLQIKDILRSWFEKLWRWTMSRLCGTLHMALLLHTQALAFCHSPPRYMHMTSPTLGLRALTPL